ncbi:MULTISPECIES: helix-turn-helix transcriptional regulator [unclassified Bradyrhizobium]|uniref:helix-turn-helix domain-containing protein n=1 Tax=unclassified Bradyrhizobium TaxID=2631580 RepID=UPI00247AD376|nr:MULTISPECIES: helix-turn-helix transcriptional regulator [unclassified Bradyrhizobium]WGS23646.1 helix-turn-helix transcriptional regulator [Bradyrhizobium sp. ISRA463]WGS30672.1 helix-turn-helix transcriptional regulator [Bradyrhizobium sp. ISRA464]
MTGSAPATTWNYRRTDVAGIVELASWRGAGSLGLRPHFHDETQIVLVLSGSRAFRINGATVTVPARHAAIIPAGLLHAPTPTSDKDTVCLNAYVPASRSPSTVLVSRFAQRWQDAADISPEHILEIADEVLSHERVRVSVTTDKAMLGERLTDSVERIGDIAARLGRSREGFTRLVTRELGIAPHTFRMLARLNLARRLLRQGWPIAAVAAEAGFSDQSHLTRRFRRTFGTTPGGYWRD